MHCWKHKIGISNKPMKRQKQIQTGNAETVSVRYVFELRDRSVAASVEKKIHDYLSFIHIRGEWFAFPPVFEFLIVLIILFFRFTTWR